MKVTWKNAEVIFLLLTFLGTTYIGLKQIGIGEKQNGIAETQNKITESQTSILEKQNEILKAQNFPSLDVRYKTPTDPEKSGLVLTNKGNLGITYYDYDITQSDPNDPLKFKSPGPHPVLAPKELYLIPGLPQEEIDSPSLDFKEQINLFRKLGKERGDGPIFILNISFQQAGQKY